jgi:hypothetical protein
MKKNLLIVGLLAFVAVLGVATQANATWVEKYADGAVGTEDADTKLCRVITTCQFSASGSSIGSVKKNCFVRLIAGDSATVGPTDVSMISFSASVTNPTANIDLCAGAPLSTKYNHGLFFDNGLYMDVVTGEASVSFDYFQQP